MPTISPLTIKELVDTNYTTISIMEDMQHVAEWLQVKDYFAVMDEELKITGIVTMKDVQLHPHNQVIDADIYKPGVTTQQSIFEVFKIMEDAQSDFLPVYMQGMFIGVITLRVVAKRLIAHLNQIESVRV